MGGFAPQRGYFLDNDNEPKNIIENVTGAVKTTESDHTLNHIGRGYKAFIEYSGSLASGASLSWCLTGPTTKFAHIKNLILTALGSSAKLEILKDSTVTLDTGNEVSLINTNHNSTDVPESVLRAGPTYDADGIVWEMAVVLIDSTAQNVGSASISGGLYEEIITKSAGEKYIVKLTNTGADALTKAFIKLFMYEEDEGIY